MGYEKTEFKYFVREKFTDGSVQEGVSRLFIQEKRWDAFAEFLKANGLWNYGHSTYPTMVRLFPAIGDVPAGETRNYYSHPQHSSYDTRPGEIARWKGGAEQIAITEDFDREFQSFLARMQ